MRILAAILILVCCNQSWGQDALERSSKFYFGLNLGAYWANKYTASRYDGWDAEYEYNYGIDKVIIGNQQIYNRIYNAYDQRDFVFCEYPGLDPADPIKYRTAMLIGGHMGYYLNDMTALILDVDYIRLKVVDGFNFCIDDPLISEPIVMTETITGEERRFQAQLGLHFEFSEEVNSAYFDIGGGFNSAIVEENKVVVQGMTYILTRRSPNNPNAYKDVDFGGSGFGGYAGLGYRFKFNESFSFDLGSRGLYQKINIGPEEAQKMKFQFEMYLRMLWL